MFFLEVGFWILVLVFFFEVGFWSLDLGVWILEFVFWILVLGSCVFSSLDLVFGILNLGFWWLLVKHVGGFLCEKAKGLEWFSPGHVKPIQTLALT